MDKVDNALDSSRKAYAELMGTRTRQLDKQVERVDELRLTAGLDRSDELESSVPALGVAVDEFSEDE